MRIQLKRLWSYRYEAILTGLVQCSLILAMFMMNLAACLKPNGVACHERQTKIELPNVWSMKLKAYEHHDQ